MKWQQVRPSPGAAYVLVLEPEEEAVEALTEFARAQGVGAAQVTAVGAFRHAVLGWFDREARSYREITVDEQCEVLSFLGDIAVAHDGPAPHVHAVVGRHDGTTRGGHLLEGRVWPTLEIVIQDSPARLAKTFRPDLGLALIDPS